MLTCFFHKFPGGVENIKKIKTEKLKIKIKEEISKKKFPQF